MSAIQYAESRTMRLAAVERHPVSRGALDEDTGHLAEHTVITARIDHLLELGRLLLRLAETVIEESGNTEGFLPGALQTTRLPLRLKEVELNLTAFRALGGEPPQAVVTLVEGPKLLKQLASSSVLRALDEINEAIRSEGLTLAATA
jgi:hypothetical protein